MIRYIDAIIHIHHKIQILHGHDEAVPTLRGIYTDKRFDLRPDARYLNVSKNLASDWERDVKKPGGPALRLLALIQKKGLMAIA